ncbi:leukotriene B4 receptor 1-like [Pelobates fuscus]|uniref:leukotriene B4 receptor 1-like n=1 Tax=Pelobates fuscus TaxID=191477 RepID=UPI002FE4605F
MTETTTVPPLKTTFNYSPTNSTERPTQFSSSLGIAILSIAFIIGFPGNAFIIWTVLTRIKKRTVTCILILHLAIADIIVLLTAPFFIHLLVSGKWIFGSVVCKLCHYIGCLSMFVSIYLITFMSVDRFLAVVIPFSIQKIRTKTVIRTSVLAIWMLSTLLAIPMLFYRSLHADTSQCNPTHQSSGHIVFQYLFEFLLGFLFPFIVIVFCYLYICIRLQGLKFQRKQKTSQLVIIIVVSFALFWFPYQMINLIQVLGETISSTNTAEKFRRAALFARPNVTALAFFSSSVNPVLYTFAGGSFIRTAGVGFMAKVFEGTSSEAPSFRKVTNVFRQKSRNKSVELGTIGEVPEESKIFTANQTE